MLTSASGFSIAPCLTTIDVNMMRTNIKNFNGARIIVLCILFICLFQLFYYVIDIAPLYIFSKIIFPSFAVILSYVLFLHFFFRSSFYPYTFYFIFTFVYLIIQSAVLSYFNFSQPINLGVLAQVKLLPIFYYFCGLFLLKKMKVTQEDITYSLIILGAVSFMVYFMLYSFVDLAEFATDESRLVLYDEERGLRITLSTAFGIFFLFYSYRSIIEKKKIVFVLPFLLLLLYLLLYRKQRLEMLGVALMLFFISIKVFLRKPATVVLAASLIIMLILVTPALSPTGLSFFYEDAFYYSFILRWNTIKTILEILSKSTCNILFGVGNLNRTGDLNFQTVYGQNFWPSDVGWLGTSFEYGLIGSLFFVYLYVLLIKNSYQYSTNDTPLILIALRDYVYMSIALSILIPSIPYFIGIYATILAIFVYYNRYLCPQKLN